MAEIRSPSKARTNSAVSYEDLADYPVGELPALNREMTEVLIPPEHPHAGRTSQRP